MKILTYTTSADHCYMMPDSSLLRNNDAFYMPTEGTVGAQACLYVTVARLAKSIAPRFADRTVSTMGACINFTRTDLLQQARTEGEPWTEAVGFDRSTAVSVETLPIDSFAALHSASLCVTLNGKEVCRTTLALAATDAATLISRLTQQMTLRIGDVVALPVGAEFAVASGDTVRATLNGATLLDFDIK